ncbi:MAG: DUF6152 family protein [Betaproteobacteria bacterium]
MIQRRMLLLLLAVVPLAAIAHHGWSEYDSTKPLQLTGTIVDARYSHPHGIVMLKTADKTWLAVLAPPSRMESRGLTREMLKEGNTATVEGYPNKSNPDEMRSERITIAGKTFELR